MAEGRTPEQIKEGFIGPSLAALFQGLQRDFHNSLSRGGGGCLMSSDKPKEERTWTEEIEVFGNELVEQVKRLVAEGNVRRLIVRTPDGHVLIELPLTTGMAVGGVVTLMAPVLAAIGALAALLAHAKIEVVRTGNPGAAGSNAPQPDSRAGNRESSKITEGGQGQS